MNLSCNSSDWILSSPIPLTGANNLFTKNISYDFYSIFGEKEFAPYLDYTGSERFSFLVPKLDNANADEGDLGAIVCGDAWNDGNTNNYPEDNTNAYLFLTKANKAQTFGDVFFIGQFTSYKGANFISNF